MAEDVGALDEHAAADGELEALSTARALRLDVAVRMERPRDPERVPTACSGPRPTAGPNQWQLQ